MRRITVVEHVSLDGVFQAPGGPDEDTSGGFDRGGWGQAYNDEVLAGGPVGCGRSVDRGCAVEGGRMATAERGAGTGIFRRKPLGAPDELPGRAGAADRGPARSLGLWQPDPVTWLRFAAWFVLGVLVYPFYGYRRSALAPRD